MTLICNRRALVSALLLALAAAPTTLLAQDEAEAAPDAAESTEMEAVTVTAQSRSQEVQDVPIAVSVVTEKQVENLVATDLSEIARYVPGLSVDAFDKTQPGFSIRGISTEGFSMGIDRAVGVYINGVYQTNGGGSLLALNDVQRIEVLKGPQGTLFGRNTAAGAISIVTNAPTNDFEATARGRIGNDGQRYFDGLLNMPLGETFGVRVSALTNRSDGWAEDAGTGRQYALDRQEGARIAIGGMLSDTWEMQLSFDHERLKEPQRLQIGVLPFLSNTTQRAPFPPNPASYQDPRDVPIYQDVFGGRQTKGYDGGTLQFIGSLDWATFTSTTAFSESDLEHFEDQDGTNDPTVRLDSGVTQSGRTLYQEFKFAGANDRIDWVAGASYYREEGEQSNIVNSSTSTIDTLLFNQGIRNPCGGPLACVDFAFRLGRIPLPPARPRVQRARRQRDDLEVDGGVRRRDLAPHGPRQPDRRPALHARRQVLRLVQPAARVAGPGPSLLRHQRHGPAQPDPAAVAVRAAQQHRVRQCRRRARQARHRLQRHQPAPGAGLPLQR
jgi:iron complex outermembrane receptor protein